MKNAWNMLVAAVLTAAGTIIYTGAASTPSVAVASVQPPPPSLSVRLFGPKEILSGREYFFHVDLHGKAGMPRWRVIPPSSNALMVFPDGMKARFQTSEPGHYAVMVSVAGEGMDVASDVIEVENLAVVDLPEDEEAPELIEEPPVITGPPQPITATVADLVKEAYVQAGRPSKAHSVAGSIRSLIGRIESGLLPPDADVVHELQAQLDSALGDDARHWGGFVESLNAIIVNLRGQGHVTTIGSTVPTLQEAAAVLGMQE